MQLFCLDSFSVNMRTDASDKRYHQTLSLSATSKRYHQALALMGATRLASGIFFSSLVAREKMLLLFSGVRVFFTYLSRRETRRPH